MFFHRSTGELTASHTSVPVCGRTTHECDLAQLGKKTVLSHDFLPSTFVSRLCIEVLPDRSWRSRIDVSVVSIKHRFLRMYAGTVLSTPSSHGICSISVHLWDAGTRNCVSPVTDTRAR